MGKEKDAGFLRRLEALSWEARYMNLKNILWVRVYYDSCWVVKLNVF
jgi:hypothetical protein